MAVTTVSICNSALVKVGSDTISSLTQETKSARILNAIYEYVRDVVLRAHPWNFATKRAALTPTANVPTYEYAYEYDIPNDCLRVLDEEYDDTDWVVEGAKILSNSSTLNIRYIYQNTDPSSYDSMFAEALSWRLAREVGYGLSQSTALMEMCDKQYRAVLAEARSMDAAEGTMKGLVVNDWTNARR